MAVSQRTGLQQAEEQVAPEGKSAGSPVVGESGNAVSTGVSPVVSFEDMDGDGDSDIVVTRGGVTSHWLENTVGKDAESLFKLHIFRSITPTAIAVADMDGDGTTDIVVGHMGGATLFFNDGQWTANNLGISLSTPHTILLEDVNKDQLVDVVIRDSRELVYVQNVKGQLGPYSMSWPNLGDGSLLAVGDLDLTNSAMEILTLNGQGVLGMAAHDGRTWQPVKSISPLGVAAFDVADINRDGLPDVYIEDRAGNRVWLEGDGTGGVKFHSADDPPAAIAEIPLEPAAGERTVGATEDIPVEFDLSPPLAPMGTSPDDAAMSKSSMSDGAGVMAMNFASFFMAMDSVPPPMEIPVEPAFDFQALPDLEFDLDPDATVDYSASHQAVVVDLEYGETASIYSFFGGFFGGMFSFWMSTDHWDDTDLVVNGIGSGRSDDIYGNIHDNVLDGGSGHDWLFGFDGDDTLVGGQGDDVLFGDEGDDLVIGGSGSDVLFGDEGDDVMYGGWGDDYIVGGYGDDTMLGGNGADFINGNQGDDVLHGGMGADKLIGDGGSDTFHYVSAEEGGDTILQFTRGEDSFEFEFGVKTLHVVTEPYGGDLGIQGEGFVWEVGDHGEGTLYYDADTSTVGDETLIAEVTLDGGEETLHVDDIVIV